MGEGGGGAGSCIALIVEIHGGYQTVTHGKYVENLAVGKDIPLETFYELVHVDEDSASVLLGH